MASEAMAQAASAHMTTHRGVWSFLRPVTAIPLCAVCVCGGGLAAPASAQQAAQIKFGGQFPPTFEYVYRHYALDGGFLGKQGLRAEFVGFSAGLTGIQALASGSVDFACEGVGSFLAAIQAGADLKIVFVPNANNSYVIVTRASIEKPENLAGKKWAVTQVGAISHSYAVLWLRQHNMKENSVDWIPIGGEAARARALLAGQVDATLLNVGELLRIEGQAGIKRMAYLRDTLPPLPNSACATTGKIARERADVVQRFVNGNLDAIRAARTPAGKQQYLAAAKKYDDHGYTDKQYEELYDFYIASPKNPLSLDPNGGMYPDVLQENMRIMVAAGSLKGVLPLERVWEPKFVLQYLADNGWFDIATAKGGYYLKDLLK